MNPVSGETLFDTVPPPPSPLGGERGALPLPFAGETGRARRRRALRLAVCLLFSLFWLTTAAEQAPHAPPRLQVRIDGLQGELLDNVRASLGLLRNADEPQLPDQRIQWLYERSETEIRRALEPFGYYRPSVQSSLAPPQGDVAPWIASYLIDPGPPLLIGELDLQLGGMESDLSGQFPLAVGDRLDHRLYKQGKQALLAGARDAGYLAAALAMHRIEIDSQAYRATVRVHLAPGPLHRFCGVTFDQSGFREEYLRAFVPMRKGDPYTEESEAELRRALSDSGHFLRVEIERLAADDTPGDVYLLVHLEARKPNRYRARFGWGTDTGFGLNFDWTRRNLWHEGHQLNLGVAAVQKRAKLVGEANYTIPSDPLFNQHIEFFGRHQGKDLSGEDAGIPGLDSKTRILNNTFGLRLPRPRRLWGGLELEESLSLTYLTESYDLFDMLFGDLTEFIQEQIALAMGEDREVLQGDYQGLVLGADWTYRTMDAPLFARRGDYLRLSLKGSSSAVLSNFSFLQTHLRAATIRPLLDDGRLILRGEAAYTLVETRRIDSLGGVVANQLPELYEFRAGGDRSVRGYAYEELLPIDGFTGGKHLLVGSVEYEHTVIPNWAAAVFV